MVFAHFHKQILPQKIENSGEIHKKCFKTLKIALKIQFSNYFTCIPPALVLKNKPVRDIFLCELLMVTTYIGREEGQTPET